MRNLMRHEQAQEHAAVFQMSTSHAFQGLNIPQQISSGSATGEVAGGYTRRQQTTALSPRSRAPASNPMNFLQRVMHLPGGQVSLQQNFIQLSPSLRPVNLQSSVAPSASQPTPLGGAQVHGHHKHFVEMPVPYLSNAYDQLTRAVERGEKNLNAAGASCRNDMQRQALRARLDSQKELLINIRDLIKSKRQGYLQGYASFLTYCA
ncbi:hypothetical protein EDB89DRAFT_1170960 [Lactarius sanguifluus]|nr:hypothetical protein EDB89DRAFT_1170960 [Lactarius sanguifluus]